MGGDLGGGGRGLGRGTHPWEGAWMGEEGALTHGRRPGWGRKGHSPMGGGLDGGGRGLGRGTHPWEGAWVGEEGALTHGRGPGWGRKGGTYPWEVAWVGAEYCPALEEGLAVVGQPTWEGVSEEAGHWSSPGEEEGVERHPLVCWVEAEPLACWEEQGEGALRSAWSLEACQEEEEGQDLQ